jgi:hypothetical protein
MLAAILVLLMASCSGSPPPGTSSQPTGSPPAAQLDRLLAGAVAQPGGPPGVIGYLAGPSGVWQAAAGLANLATRWPPCATGSAAPPRPSPRWWCSSWSPAGRRASARPVLAAGNLRRAGPCAYRLAGRVIQAGIVSGLASLDRPGALAGMNSGERRIMLLARRRPWLARRLVGVAVAVEGHRPGTIYHGPLRALPECDRAGAARRKSATAC